MFTKRLPGLTINLGLCRLRLDATWILVAPLTTWIIAKIYIPLIDSSLSLFQYWLTAIAIMLLIFMSLVIHVLGHVIAAKFLKNPIPEKLSLFLLADPAQVWPMGLTAGRDALSALAGPLLNILLAVLSYFVWNLQVNIFFNSISLFMAIFNLVLAVINLNPGFPLDGGRLVRSIIWSVFRSPALGTRLAKGFGFCIVAFQMFWGLALVIDHSRLVFAAASIAFAQACLFLNSLLFGGRASQSDSIEGGKPRFNHPIKWALVLILILPLLAFTTSLVPLNLGLKAPGTTASVEPMVQIPQQYVYESKGKLILTSIIPQAPILFFEWVYSRFDTSVQIVTEEEIVPPDQTIQSQAEQGHRMLVSSENIATAEGLRLAGFQVTELSDGVVIDAVSPDSPAATLLEIGDIITKLNGQDVKSTNDLQGLLRIPSAGAILSLGIIRDGQSITVEVPVLAPAAPGGPVRIGIVVHTDLTGFDFPFPVEIKPEKIVGGPSAGLMFTLAVYDLVTPGDLTKGLIIAGTGTIDIDGNVGPIGGVQQKVVAAERAGAKYFLVPAENYRDAVIAANNINVIMVTSAQDAIDALASLAPG